MNAYDIGDVVRLTGTFTQSAVAIDPSTVSLVLRRPDGIKRTYVYGTDSELSKVSTGIYRLDYDAVVPGEHWYRFVSTGTGKAAEEESFLVRQAHATE